MPDWLFATHLKDTTQSMEAFNRTALPISRLLADADMFYSCAVSYQGPLYCEQDSNDQLISYRSTRTSYSLFEALQEDSSQLRDQITLSALWDRCNLALQVSAPITSRPANTDLEVANWSL